MRLTIKTPAKVNLLLKVNGIRTDNYHEILTVLHMISLYDEITFTPLESSVARHRDETLLNSIANRESKAPCEFLTGFTDFEGDIKIVCNANGVSRPKGIQKIENFLGPPEDNLAFRAAKLLKEKTKVSAGVRIEIRKGIPISAGLGGGSSDAAATLIALNYLWKTGLSRHELMEIGSSLGTDVPFFIYGTAAIGTGRGDKLMPFKPLPALNLLIVNPLFPVSTAWVYRNYNKPQYLTDIDYNVKILSSFSLNELSNDLEDVVIKEYPLVKELKKALAENGAIAAVMTGSGPTVFGIYPDETAINEAKKGMQRRGYWVEAVKTLESSPLEEYLIGL
ncbi:MAG: 4-(cytidine 5'-diphospho)-2-C-methyl-D-erythritol kinase [Nitrospirota bacterium]